MVHMCISTSRMQVTVFHRLSHNANNSSTRDFNSKRSEWIHNQAGCNSCESVPATIGCSSAKLVVNAVRSDKNEDSGMRRNWCMVTVGMGEASTQMRTVPPMTYNSTCNLSGIFKK